MSENNYPGFPVAALALAVFFRAHPLKVKEKTPLIVAWQKVATREESTLLKWGEEFPNANVGIATGDGLVVVDIDPRHGGDVALAALELEHGPLPETVTVDTGGGGVHYYFKEPAGEKLRNSAGLIGEGIDVRANGGYVVAPPSVHPSGGVYNWRAGHGPDDLAVAELPRWILHRLLEKKRKAPSPKGAHQPDSASAATVVVFPEGQRHHGLVSLAGTMRRRGLTAEEMLPSLLETNRTRCRPPLAEEEVADIARKVQRYQPADSLSGDNLPLTESGNAERLALRCGRDVRYCNRWKTWLLWDKRRWRRDETIQIQLLCKDTVRALGDAAAVEPDEKRAEKMAAFAKTSESKSARNSMVELARAEPGIAITSDAFDRDLWSLNVNNGTIDLRTGELRPHRRADHLTKLASVDFDPEAACPTWMGFLSRIMQGSEPFMRFIQRAVGYTLTGDTGEHCLFLMVGNGSNGKSTFIEVVREMMGDYAKGTPFATFLDQDGDKGRNDLAALAGARMVSAGEPDEDKSLSTSVIKTITGGDTVTARFLYCEFFDFVPQFKLWLHANHLPRIRQTDEGIWRRIRLLPFTAFIPPAERDHRLKEKLVAELPGILAWAVRGCLEWQKEGLADPEEVLRATAGYRSDMDVVAQFIGECCVVHPEAKVAATALYSCYRQWAQDGGDRPMSQRALGTRLTEGGFARGKIRGNKVYRGIGLADSRECQDHDGGDDGDEGSHFSETPSTPAHTHGYAHGSSSCENAPIVPIVPPPRAVEAGTGEGVEEGDL